MKLDTIVKTKFLAARFIEDLDTERMYRPPYNGTCNKIFLAIAKGSAQKLWKVGRDYIVTVATIENSSTFVFLATRNGYIVDPYNSLSFIGTLDHLKAIDDYVASL